MMQRKQLWLTALVAALSLAAGALILGTGQHAGHDDAHGHGASTGHDSTDPKGPRGGRLLEKQGFALEVTIFEKGVPPEFRVYAYENGRPIDPAGISLQATLSRLGRPPESIEFRAQAGYLRGERVVTEPHSFAVTLEARRGEQSYQWTFEQFEGRVTMTDATAQAAGILVGVAGPAQVRTSVSLRGEVRIDQHRMVRVSAQVPGVVTRALPRLGDRVRRGDVIASLRSAALGELRSEFLATRERSALARTNLERETRLFEEKISAEQDLLTARQASAEAAIAHRNARQKLVSLGVSPGAIEARDDADLSRLELRAPIDGVVIERRAADGQAVGPDEVLYVVADLDSVWVDLTVPPADLDAVRPGQRATVRSAATGASAQGEVFYLGALVGEQTRTATARVRLPNKDGRWRPGLFVDVELVREERKVPVAVPPAALQRLRDWTVVFVRHGEVFEARPVQTGRRDAHHVEIIEGLAPGDRFAAANSFLLKADLGKAGASHDH